MKCPKCQTENKPTAKFCVGCGTNLTVFQQTAAPEQPTVTPNPIPTPAPTPAPAPTPVPVPPVDEERTVVINSASNSNVCSCGAPLKPGAKFCSVCGKVVSPISGIQDSDDTLRPNNNIPPVQPVPPVKPVKPVQPVKPAQPVNQMPPVSPVPPVKPIKPDKDMASGKKKKSNGPLIVTLIILSIITILIVVFLAKVVLTMKDNDCSFTEAIDVIFDGDDKDSSDSKKDDSEDEEEADADEEDAIVAPITEEELEPANKLVETAKGQIESGEFDNGYSTLDNALSMYGDLYVKYEGSEESQEAIQQSCDTAFELYKSGVYSRGDQMLNQSLQKGLFTQIKTDADRAKGTADKMAADYEITLETSDLDDFLEQSKDGLRQRYIAEYDALIAEWSRTTAWNLADSAESDGLFDKNDLDDPLRLRWCYAYAGITRKEVEEDLAAGKITNAQAAQTLEGIIAECDYNPALILDCANKYTAAGQPADYLYDAYNVVHDEIYYAQNLDIGYDVSLDKEPGKEQFWYFNDFEADPQISSYNGVTVATRQTIRSKINL